MIISGLLDRLTGNLFGSDDHGRPLFIPYRFLPFKAPFLKAYALPSTLARDHLFNRIKHFYLALLLGFIAVQFINLQTAFALLPLGLAALTLHNQHIAQKLPRA